MKTAKQRQMETYKGARNDRSTIERKRSIVKRWLEVECGDLCVSRHEFCKAYGISDGSLTGWIKMYGNDV